MITERIKAAKAEVVQAETNHREQKWRYDSLVQKQQDLSSKLLELGFDNTTIASESLREQTEQLELELTDIERRLAGE